MYQISLVSSQALLIKTVTEILFGQCTFSKSHQTIVFLDLCDFFFTSGLRGPSALGIPYKKFGVVHPAQIFIPKAGPSMVQRTMTRFSGKSPERGTAPWRGTHFALRISQYWKRVLSHFFWFRVHACTLNSRLRVP